MKLRRTKNGAIFGPPCRVSGERCIKAPAGKSGA